MARCYHDNQKLQSDLNIEVAREGDMLKEGQDLKKRKCDKNPGHKDFIPFKDLTLEHLPIEHRNRKTFVKIKMKGNRVVRLVVDKLENGKLIKYAGTGCVDKLGDVYYILTNNHVVKTDDEVKRCTVDFHYDDDSRSSVLISRGVELFYTSADKDISYFKFHPVPYFLHQHDWEEGFINPSIVIMYKNNQIVTDQISTYRKSPLKFCSIIQNLNRSLNYLMFISHPDGSNSYLKSSHFKFQPTPSNIQQLPPIDVHIDEDDGNSRVIPGVVVKFGDEFVVKLSESIFQDEVKKCRLVLNGEVIGRGTRLYFIEGRENLWLFDIYPIPRYLEDILQSEPSSYNILCCIGHPHGGIKMITFGQYLGEDKERFDTKYRHITKPGPDCQCTEVNCLKYSCKTCPGSSGSPVFGMNEEENWNVNFTHFMCKRVVRRLSNVEVIEKNVNMAWTPTIETLIKTRK